MFWKRGQIKTSVTFQTIQRLVLFKPRRARAHAVIRLVQGCQRSTKRTTVGENAAQLRLCVALFLFSGNLIARQTHVFYHSSTCWIMEMYFGGWQAAAGFCHTERRQPARNSHSMLTRYITDAVLLYTMIWGGGWSPPETSDTTNGRRGQSVVTRKRKGSHANLKKG